MVRMILEYARTHPTAYDPQRANPSDAGLDVFYSPENQQQAVSLNPGESRVIPTGLRFGIPHGYMLEVKNRSSVAAKQKISEKENQISKKGECSWTEVECLGACVNAPMMQINDKYYEDLDETSASKIIESIFQDKILKPGSYRGRKNTSPENKIKIEDKHA